MLPFLISKRLSGGYRRPIFQTPATLFRKSFNMHSLALVLLTIHVDQERMRKVDPVRLVEAKDIYYIHLRKMRLSFHCLNIRKICWNLMVLWCTNTHLLIC